MTDTSPQVKRIEKVRRITRLLLFLSPLGLCVGAIIISNVRTAQFCTLNDEVYQMIESNVKDWLVYFQTLPKNEYPALNFSAPSGRVFTVNGSLWDIGLEPPELYVQTEYLRFEPYGLKGYEYLPAGKSTLDRRYRVQYLANDIYCYNLR